MDNQKVIRGYVYAFLGYFIWGVLPVFWHRLGDISSIEILLCRIIFSVITLLIYVYISKNALFISYLEDKKTRRSLMITASLLAVNWGIFVYAVNSSHVVQASLGYYINPLFSILLGVIFFKEKLDKIKIAAIVLAAIGVAYMTFSLGEFPYLSLALAVSFGLYGYMKKRLQLDSYNSLLVETALLSVIAVIYSIYLFASNTSSIKGLDTVEIVLVLASGIVTCLPLILFNEGAKRIPMSALGFLQYLAPTMMLLLGVFLYGEAFTKVHLISFIFIWFGYFMYIFSIILYYKKPSKIVKEI
ncbi:MAG: EamA family transporter RarD [Eubacteriales bacterium]